MKQILFLFFLCLLLTVSESNLRRRYRRQYSGYNYVQQYNNQYGLYGPGGQGWINNYDNRYPNGNFAWNNNYNWNHAALLVIVSISRPKWVLSDNQGETSLGLIETCITTNFESSEEKCFIPHRIRAVWIITFGLAITSIVLLTLTVLLFLASQFTQASTVEYGRHTGFIAMICLCLSTVLFPMGFDSEIIGGSSFQLPTDYHIGPSYVAFVGATWLAVVSTIISGKMCLPRFGA